MNKNMTVIEWLMQTLEQNNIIDLDWGESDKYYTIIDQAKEMERNQIIEAWENGLDNFLGTNDSDIMSAEQYYNETFGGAGETRS
jgi:hypothetical protein